MRKVILFFSILILCVSCEKECDCNDNNSNNTNSSGNNLPPQNCGNVTMNVNYLTNEIFNSTQYEVSCSSSLDKVNGVFSNLRLDLGFSCNYTIPGTSTSIPSPIRIIIINYYFSNGFQVGYDAYYCGGNEFFSTFYNHNNNTDSIIVNLTNIDEVNYEISGDVSIIDLSGIKPNIDLTFVDVPVVISTATK